LVDAGIPQHRQVIAVGMHQQQVDAVRIQTLEAALHGQTRMSWREIETGLPLFELLAGLADDHPLVTLVTQQLAEALLADTVGRRRIDQVDTQFACLFQQSAGLGIVGNGKAVGVLHALVTAQFDRTQDRKSTRLNSSHVKISYAVLCLKKKK